MGGNNNTMIKMLLIVGGLGLLYWYLNESGLWAQWFGTTATVTPAVPATPSTVSTALVNIPPTTVVTTAPLPSLPSSYTAAAVAMQAAANAAAGGSGTTIPGNFDDWSYWWQNAPSFSGAPAGFGTPNGISPTLADAIIAAGGGNRSANITPLQWVSWLYQEQQLGISGLDFAWNGEAVMSPYGWN